MNVLIFGLLVTLTLHFAWEMLQAPAFVNFAVSTWEGTLRCLVASRVGALHLAGVGVGGH